MKDPGDERPAANDDVIVAAATAPGESAIAVVRLSGRRALDSAAKFIRWTDRPSPRAATLCQAACGAETLDQILLTYFPGPNSYTGEDLVELSSHGSPYIVSRLVQEAVAAGARLAEPGEFTRRAFLNGRMDLAQAEAVCDLIRSRTRQAHRAALSQLEGGLSRRLSALRTDIVDLLASVEAQLDHPEEDIPVISRSESDARVHRIAAEIEALLSTYKSGKLISEGARVAIVGRPNVGKSSLLNALLGRDRAIVSETAGTTRDTLEEAADLRGVKAVLIDTAGLRDGASDPIEHAGMERSRAALRSCDVALLVLDRSRPLGPEDKLLLQEIAKAGAETGRQVLCAFNKSDMPAQATPADLGGPWPCVEISALRGDGMDRLAAAVSDAARRETSDEGVVLTSLRQKAAMEQALDSIRRASGLAERELTALHLREALAAIGSLVGEAASDEILHSIFSRFCIGK